MIHLPDSYVASVLSRAHPTVVRAVNRRRREMGLAEVRVAGDSSARPLRVAKRAMPAVRGRKPAGSSTWPRRPKSRAEHELLRQRAAAFIAKWARPCQIARERELERLWRK